MNILAYGANMQMILDIVIPVTGMWPSLQSSIYEFSWGFAYRTWELGGWETEPVCAVALWSQSHQCFLLPGPAVSEEACLGVDGITWIKVYETKLSSLFYLGIYDAARPIVVPRHPGQLVHHWGGGEAQHPA